MAWTIAEKVAARGGKMLRGRDTVAIVLPLDGEFILGHGLEAEDVFDAILASDGLAGADGDVQITPYLTLEEAMEAAGEAA